MRGKDRKNAQKPALQESLNGPVRTCVACRKKGERQKMLRFVRHKDGEIAFDKKRIEVGRGANICRQRLCFDLAIERRAFGRAFKKEVLIDKKSLESVVF